MHLMTLSWNSMDVAPFTHTRTPKSDGNFEAIATSWFGSKLPAKYFLLIKHPDVEQSHFTTAAHNINIY